MTIGNSSITDSFNQLSFTELNSSSRGDAVAGQGGAVSIFANGGNVTGNGNIITSSIANGDAGNGGNVLISDDNVASSMTLGTIDTSSRSLGGAGAVGNGGSVNAIDTNSISITNIDTSVISPSGSGGSAGSVELSVAGGNGITVGTIMAKSDVATVAGTANGGSVSLGLTFLVRRLTSPVGSTRRQPLEMAARSKSGTTPG